ncbi:MAG: hypothetical protein LBS76_03565 [Mycoplasmataceae bacterium]|jgi:hypothetical protein|nr:hypothetical protein [Mycoplasmataceae bacterium]
MKKKIDQSFDVSEILTPEQAVNLKANFKKLKNGEYNFTSREQVFDEACAKFITPSKAHAKDLRSSN